MQIQINLNALDKVQDLTLPEYLVLCILYEIPELELRDADTRFIVLELENKGFLRMINNVAVLDGKAVQLFENSMTIKAKEILDYMNELKKDLGISSRPFSYRTHSRELIARLSEGVDVELIKDMLQYKYNVWKNTEWQMYLRPSTLFNKTKFYNYLEELEQRGNRVNNSTYQMV